MLMDRRDVTDRGRDPRFEPRLGRLVRLAAITLVAATVLGLGACGDDDSSNGASSVTQGDVENASGTINVLGWQFYQNDGVQNAGPVKAEWAYISAPQEIVTKAQASTFDALTNGAGVVAQLDALGLIAPIDTGLLTNYDVIDSSLRSDSVHMNADGEVVEVPYVISPSLTAYNSAEVPEPESLDDLLDPVYRDKIALFDSPFETIGGLAVAQGVEDTRDMTQEELDRVLDYLNELRPNIKTFYQFGEDVQLFNRGDVAVTMNSFGSLLAKAIENNPAIEFNFLGELTFADSWSVGTDGNQAAALNWIDRTLSSEGQEAIVEGSGSYPVNPAALPAFRALGDPVSLAVADLSVSEILGQAPLSRGFALESDGGDVVTLDEVTRAWEEFRASF